MTMDISDRYGNVLYTSEKQTTREALVEAVRAGADLAGAKLAWSDLA